MMGGNGKRECRRRKAYDGRYVFIHEYAKEKRNYRQKDIISYGSVSEGGDGKEIYRQKRVFNIDSIMKMKFLCTDQK